MQRREYQGPEHWQGAYLNCLECQENKSKIHKNYKQHSTMNKRIKNVALRKDSLHHCNNLGKA